MPVEVYGNGGRDVITVIDAQAVIDGGMGDDILTGGSAMDTIIGGRGDDKLIGGGNEDRLFGDEGNDFVFGEWEDNRFEASPGNDHLFGGPGIDHLVGGGGDDEMDGGAGADVLHGGRGGDTMKGGEGSGRDILYGDEGMDALHGGGGEDTLIGGADGDSLFGGDDNDVLFGDGAYAEPDVTRPDGDDRLYGQEGDDLLFGEGGGDSLYGDDAGQTGDDVLVGDSGEDTLEGGDGDDQLLGGDDEDELFGGEGDDVLNGGLGKDMLFGQRGEDTLQIDFASTDGVAEDEFSGGLDRDQLAIVGAIQQIEVDGQQVIDSNIDDHIQIEQIDGDHFKAINLDPETGAELQTFLFMLDSSLEGDVEQLGIQGLGGNDVLEVVITDPLAGKNFVLDGGAGDDTLRGGAGRDVLRGGTGDDKLFGEGNEDVLYGDEGRDELDGGAGVDLVYAGPGGDTVLGGDGREIIRGGPDDDFLVAGTGFYGSVITGGAGNDIIIGSSGIDTLDGGIGDDVILGGDLGDLITGGPAMDPGTGETDDDTLVGELGRDNIVGGFGDDQIFTHLNNDLRAQLGLDPVEELTESEVQSRVDRLQADELLLKDIEAALLAIPENQRTAEQLIELQNVQNALTILDFHQIDYRKYQTVYLDTAQGGFGDDAIYGSPNFDILLGGEGDDDIFASGVFGSDLDPEIDQFGDIIKGEGGTGDTLWFEGTEGDDYIEITAESDGVGNQVIAIYTDRAKTNRAGVLEELEVTTENVGVRGLAGDDEILVNFGNQALAGVVVDAGLGNDYVDASLLSLFQDNAILIGGAGNDILIGGLNDDTILGDAGDDVLKGGPGRDTIDGGPGNDDIDGGDEDDTLIGGQGHDVISGGADQRAIELGDETLLGDDRLFGGPGLDLLEAGPGDDVIHGGAEVDSILPGPGIATIASGVIQDDIEAAGDIVWQDELAAVDAEFRANTFVQGSQRTPTVAMAGDGRFVIAWQSDSAQDGSGFGIYAQLYAADGKPIGNEIRVSSNQTVSQSLASAAMADDGEFVVVWSTNGVGGIQAQGDEQGIYGQRFNSNGERVGSEFRVNSTTTNRQYHPDVAMSPSGAFVVSWISQNQDGSGRGIFAQRFSSSGERLGSEFRVNTYTANDQFGPSVAVAADGSFVITWFSRDQDGSDWGVFAQRYSSFGSPLETNSESTRLPMDRSWTQQSPLPLTAAS